MEDCMIIVLYKEKVTTLLKKSNIIATQGTSIIQKNAKSYKVIVLF